MPPVVNQAGRSIESMASQGVTGMGLIGGAAAAGVGLVAAAIGESMSKYEQLGERVENFRRVVGSTAEESSRLVYAFGAVGVSEETATQGMFKLSKAIETTPKKLADLGIEVARNSKGNVDLSKTLFNVADAYNATADPAKDMIPILEQGSAALRRLEESASLVFSDADLERLKQAKIRSQELKSSWDEYVASVGRPATEALSNLEDAMLANAYAERKVTEAQDAGTVSRSLAGPALGRLISKYEDEYYASERVKTALDTQTQALHDQAEAADALWAATDKLINQEEAQVNAGFALQEANLAVSESQGKVVAAGEAAQAAVKKYGANSDEAKVASDNYTRAVIEQEKAYYAAAGAARKLQEDTDLAETGQKDAAKEAQAYIDALQAEANTLDPSNPLRKNLQAYIDKLKNEIPSQVNTTFTTTYVSKGSHGVAMAGGGHAYAGEQLWVGEHGPEAWTPDRPGTITPTGQAPPASPAPNNSVTNNLTLVGVPAVNDPDGVRRMLLRMQLLGAGI
jgi:hypothetical protein